jgi:3'-5' exoribonuclease
MTMSENGNSSGNGSGNGRLFEAGVSPAPSARTIFIRDLTDGQSVEAVFLVSARSLRQKKNGEHFMTMTLRDRSGTLSAVCWEDASSLQQIAQPGAVVHATGRFEMHERWGAQLTVQALASVAEGHYALADLIEAAPLDPDKMEADLRRLVETVQNPSLRRLLEALYGEQSETWQRFRRAPAAKFYHQAYCHGLLEHTLSVAQAVSAISGCFPGIDRDLALTGALIHDIGKIEAYAQDPTAIDLTDAGKLHGEIPLGYYLVRSTIERIDGFPPGLAGALLHIQLSHHGTYENGSPVTPRTREATIVHTVDNLGGKLGSFDRLEKGLQEGETWTQYDRAIEGAAWFPAANGNGASPPEPAAEPLTAASAE